jgi:hypothetical protein
MESQSAKKSTKIVPTSAAVKLTPKAASTRNYFAPLRTTDMDTETTGAENMLPEQEAPKNQVDFYHKLNPSPKRPKRTCQRRVQVPKCTKWNSYHNERNGEVFSHEILPGEK